jgi:2-dehydro-3-deoxyphosphogluconate aldolase/(4S)-4-hydroxy-2-oxoglutarate aldolase
MSAGPPTAVPTTVDAVCDAAPVIPVLIVEDLAIAAPLARALVAGGLRALEVTLRSPVALDAISAMVEAAPDAIVGAGTLRTPADVAACQAAGATFGVSPGGPDALLDAAQGWPFLPGCATPTEAMRLAERGFRVVKFFPAGPAGGPSYLKALASPLPDLSFCPTGGVSLANAPEYLSLPNVRVVGGSWVAPPDALAAGDWDRVTALAREAAGLKRGR